MRHDPRQDEGLVAAAFHFAREKHAGQVRKYTFEPYITHPVAVSKMVASVTDYAPAIAAALLHDVMEDCGVGKAELRRRFGALVASYVVTLSDLNKTGNRAQRKAVYARQFINAPAMVKTVKLADKLHNAASFIEHDLKYARVYLAEARDLLPMLLGGDDKLWSLLNQLTTSDLQEVRDAMVIQKESYV